MTEMHQGQEGGTGNTLLKGIFPTPEVFIENTLVQFTSFQSLSRVRLFATP